MPSTATITGKVGPAVAMTATVFSNVTEFAVDCVNNILTIIVGKGIPQRIDIGAATTVTCTISNKAYTLTIS